MPSKGSKSINFKIELELWERLRVAAFEDRVSNSEWCRLAIEEKLERGGGDER